MDIIDQRISTMNNLLDRVAAGQTLLMTDGTPSGCYGMVEAIPTVGGYQFAARTVCSRGLGSGAYFSLDSRDDLIEHVLLMLDHAERKTPAMQAFFAKRQIATPAPLKLELQTPENTPLTFHMIGRA